MAIVSAEVAHAEQATAPPPGKTLAFDAGKGDCLACHIIEDGQNGGDVGPPLLYMQARFPDISALKAIISDARSQNIETAMPPYGPHGLLTGPEIEAIAEYLHTL